MKQQLTDLFTKLKPTVVFVKRYLAFSTVIIFLAIYAFMIYQINTLSNLEPSESDIKDVLKTIPRPKVDEVTVGKINQLQSQNVEVKSLFDQARNNPFSE